MDLMRSSRGDLSHSCTVKPLRVIPSATRKISDPSTETLKEPHSIVKDMLRTDRKVNAHAACRISMDPHAITTRIKPIASPDARCHSLMASGASDAKTIAKSVRTTDERTGAPDIPTTIRNSDWMTGPRCHATDTPKSENHHGTNESQQEHHVSHQDATNNTMTRRIVARTPPTKRRLTLSAFRRPENTIRVADPDTSRSIADDYDLHARSLGHGAFSTVRLALRRRDGVPVAVKTIAKHQVLRSRRYHKRQEEWELLRIFRKNPHIVSPVDCYETDDDVQLVLEYCNGGDLFDVIQRHKKDAKSRRHYEFPEDQASLLARQALTALADLHSKSIAHRDVKPENLLLHTEDNTTSVKLSDFGTARVLHHSGDDHAREESSGSESDGDSSPVTPPSRMRAYSTVGSHYYAAPEVCRGEGYGTAVDIYSLGVTLYVLLCGHPPHFRDDDEDDETSSVQFQGSSWKSVSEEAKELLCRMLEPDSSLRITAQEALQHGWIRASPSKLHLVRGCFQSRPEDSDDLELVRRQLCENLLSNKKKTELKRSSSSLQCERPMKRLRSQEAKAGALIAAAIAKFYKGVAAAATEAAAGIVFEEGQVVHILEDDDDDTRDDSASRAGSPALALPALSV